jgi:Tfp pilus assembly protein PilO
MGGTSPLDFDRAATEMSRLLDELERLVRDGVVVAVGLGLLGFQRAQVRRVEVTRQLRDLAAGAREQLGDLAERAEGSEALRATLQDIEQRVDRLEEQLPDGARAVMQSIREAAAGSEQAIRSAFGLS